MANNKAIQILRGANKNTLDPSVQNNAVSDTLLLDGQPFYSKYNKKLYIGDSNSTTNKSIKDLKGTEIGLDFTTYDGSGNIDPINGTTIKTSKSLTINKNNGNLTTLSTPHIRITDASSNAKNSAYIDIKAIESTTTNNTCALNIRSITQPNAQITLQGTYKSYTETGADTKPTTWNDKTSIPYTRTDDYPIIPEGIKVRSHGDGTYATNNLPLADEFKGQFKCLGIIKNSVLDTTGSLLGGGGTFSHVTSYHGYSDFSGGVAHLFAYNMYGMFHTTSDHNQQHSSSSGVGWETTNWKKVVENSTSDNIGTIKLYSDFDANSHKCTEISVNRQGVTSIKYEPSKTSVTDRAFEIDGFRFSQTSVGNEILITRLSNTNTDNTCKIKSYKDDTNNNILEIFA